MPDREKEVRKRVRSSRECTRVREGQEGAPGARAGSSCCLLSDSTWADSHCTLWGMHNGADGYVLEKMWLMENTQQRRVVLKELHPIWNPCWSRTKMWEAIVPNVSDPTPSCSTSGRKGVRGVRKWGSAWAWAREGREERYCFNVCLFFFLLLKYILIINKLIVPNNDF